MLVNLALDIARGLGAETEFWDLDVDPLPLVGEEGCWENENVKEFQRISRIYVGKTEVTQITRPR